MKINAHFIAHEFQNNAQLDVHYRLFILCIILAGLFLQLAFTVNHFQRAGCGSLFGYSSTTPDEGYRILPPSQNPQTPASNAPFSKTPAKREAARL